MRGYGSSVVGACGVGVVYDFHKHRDTAAPLVSQIRGGGAGWLAVGFIDDRNSKEAYEELCEAHKLVYQTPVRRNTNSGNDFFFAIFDTRK